MRRWQWCCSASASAALDTHGCRISTCLLFVIVPWQRYMWGWGVYVNTTTGAVVNLNLHGYCGETSIQSAGLYFGNWLSSEKVRIAGGTDRYGPHPDIVIGTSLDAAAVALQFTIHSFASVGAATPQFGAYFTWIRGHIAASHPVIIGFYERQPGGDPDFDHIMTVNGISGSALLYNDLYLNR